MYGNFVQYVPGTVIFYVNDVLVPVPVADTYDRALVVECRVAVSQEGRRQAN